MMALFDLIHKPKSTPIATLTVATVATQSAEPPVTVAKVASVTVANYTESKIDNTDDRHHCRECMNLRNGYCTRQRFRPVDDIPRRCEDFNGCPDRIGPSASGTATPASDPLLVEVWTPFSTPMMTRADNAEHATWLQRVNPKPDNPAPKPPVPEPDADRISEAEHNAQGRYFKFLATWPDGRQRYLCQMPRQTVDEMRAQYPTVTHIEPVLNEEYPHD